MTERQCLDTPAHVVSPARECTQEVPEGFANASNVFSCATGVFDVRLNVCVSETRCAFDRNHGAVLARADACVDKVEWLRASPLNYLTLDFEAATAESQSDLDVANANKLCGVGAVIEGQFCTCPVDGSSYYDLASGACVPAPEAFDGEHNIRYEVAILPNGWYMARHILLDLDACTAVDGYRTTNYQECVADCRDYADGGDSTSKGRYANGLDHAGRQICECSRNPKTYAQSLGELAEGPWACVPADKCIQSGFIDISLTKCLPPQDAEAKCSGRLSGDADVDLNGEAYISYRQLDQGVCRCMFGTGPSAGQQ